MDRIEPAVSTPTGAGAGRRKSDGAAPEINPTGAESRKKTCLSICLSGQTKPRPVVKSRKPAFRCPFRPPQSRESAVLPPDHTPTTTINMWFGVGVWSGGRRVFWAAKSVGKKVMVWKRIRN